MENPKHPGQEEITSLKEVGRVHLTDCNTSLLHASGLKNRQR